MIEGLLTVLAVPPFTLGDAPVPLGPRSAARERLVYYRAMGMEVPPPSDPEAEAAFIEDCLWWIRGGLR